jgi:hypothetical protein
MANALADADADAKQQISLTVNVDQGVQHLSIAIVALTVNVRWMARVDAVVWQGAEQVVQMGPAHYPKN